MKSYPRRFKPVQSTSIHTVCLIFLLLLCHSEAASLVTIPITAPAEEASLSTANYLSFNFETGTQDALISSLDIAFASRPESTTATLYATSVFNPSILPAGGVDALSMAPSALFPGGFSFDFGGVLVPESSFFAILISFSSAGSPVSYYRGDNLAATSDGATLHSVIVPDLLGNPDTLLRAPAVSVQGSVVPEPSTVCLSVLASSGFMNSALDRRWRCDREGMIPHGFHTK